MKIIILNKKITNYEKQNILTSNIPIIMDPRTYERKRIMHYKIS